MFAFVVFILVFYY